MRAFLLATTLLVAAPVAAQDLSVDAAALKAHVAFLASDAMKGRETGSPELAIAEQYVAAQMLAAGLKPGGPNGSWLQPVPLVSFNVADHGSLSFKRGETVTKLEWGKDYFPRGNPHIAKVALNAPVVFAGYGVVDKATGYDDYKGLDVKGKIVAVIRDAPKAITNGDARAHLAQPDEQARVAAERGAIGVILIEGTTRHKQFPFVATTRFWNRPSMTWSDGAAAGPMAPPFMYLGFDGAAKLFAGSKIKWDAVLAADAAGTKLPRGPIGVTAEGVANSEITKVAGNNVIGMLPGTDLKDQYVVLSAHLDHVGVGQPDDKGDTIYNGAMDNAVGTAAMIEVAKRFRADGKKPRRSMLFIAVTAEEKGLVGSEYFAASPTVPVGSIVADVNLDMPILTYAFEDLVAIGADHSSVGEVVAAAAATEGVKVVPDSMPEENFFVRSDHYSFVKAGIPSVSLDLGPGGPGAAASKEFLEKHYHQPSDEIGLIDWTQGLRFVKLNYAIASALADADQRPTWNKGDFFGLTFKGPMAK
ncbi:MAG: M20/M25/M40 family metallo-hydrolase [Sphingomonadales bacterium]|nr:MAG: M20/M25/M40 family metallo-hydrolase [Sphingomonadales bacterium]